MGVQSVLTWHVEVVAFSGVGMMFDLLWAFDHITTFLCRSWGGEMQIVKMAIS